MRRVGVDLGGTKIEAIALGPGGVELARERVPTPRGYEATLESLRDLVTRIAGGAGTQATVGVGIPGSISPTTGLIRNANSVYLNGRPLREDLERALGREVRLRNDADCFVWSEASDGAAAGHDSVFGVILGTGVGGGLVLNGRLWSGSGGIGGEWGHNPLPVADTDEVPGPWCWCGRHGCIESWLSGPAMSSDHERRGGGAWSAREIAAAAQEGDPAATETLARYERRLARALGTVINVVDPEVIVLGGGVSNIPDLAGRIGRLLPDFVFSDAPSVRVVRHRHGDSSGVRGAAWLWSEEEAA